MHILGIDMNSKKWGINQIYIRCMGALTVFAGIVFPVSSRATSLNVVEYKDNYSTAKIKNYYYRTLWNVAGVGEDFNQNIYVYDKSDYINVCDASGANCLATSDTKGTGCSHDKLYIDGAHAGQSWDLVSCYVAKSGVCATVEVSGASPTTGCYGYFYAPIDVMKALGCTSGDLLVSGKIDGSQCHYEAVDMPTVMFSLSCQSDYPVNPPPYTTIYLPQTPIYDVLKKDYWLNNANGIGNVYAFHEDRWVSGGVDGLTHITKDYNLDEIESYCTWGGCPGLELTDANGNYTVIAGNNASNPRQNSYGTATWGGTAPNCTASLTSKKADGTSSDAAGIWEKTCTYSN